MASDPNSKIQYAVVPNRRNYAELIESTPYFFTRPVPFKTKNCSAIKLLENSWDYFLDFGDCVVWYKIMKWIMLKTQVCRL